MEKVTNALPDRAITVEETFDLMRPPRQCGFVAPLHQDEAGRCTSIYFEHEGQMSAATFDGASWTLLSATYEDIDQYFHNDQVTEQFTDDMAAEAERQVPSPHSMFGHQVQFQAPPGFQTKLCIRHRALSPEDYDSLKAWPQLGDATAIWGNPEAGIVAVAVMELSPDGEHSVIFTNFNPEIGTWRVVDTIGLDSLPEVAGHIHKETGKAASEHYTEIEMITGPQ
ncbi:hypothetical protein [Halorubrum sp. AJ67]|uniref:hypothetical protein n=1 Tax=Halorubrum sp. AJ67 TaxID=1173487 RepID=UPI0003DD5C9E|nr:hypothetical protein [Halorubrum sp. AJ67]CDK38131.1 hypothetical protein BN903_331 [Halorubrum sp. AJ67]